MEHDELMYPVDVTELTREELFSVLEQMLQLMGMSAYRDIDGSIVVQELELE